MKAPVKSLVPTPSCWHEIGAHLVPQGREAALCSELRRLLPESVLKEAFVLRKERWMKRQGHWFLEPVSMYRGYAFAIGGRAWSACPRPTEASSSACRSTSRSRAEGRFQRRDRRGRPPLVVRGALMRPSVERGV